MSFFKKLFKSKPKDEVVETIREAVSENNELKYDNALEKSRDGFFKKIKLFFVKKREVDEAFFKELEELLVMSDVGFEYTKFLVNKIKNEVRLRNIKDSNEVLDLVFEIIHDNYLDDAKNITELNLEKGRLNVFLVIGVNGTGKTTSIGKLTKKLKDQQLKVSLVAGDTFRAGAVAQLTEWANRMDVKITIPEKEGQDPASVVYKGLDNAIANNDDVLIIDTAGRLQNKQNLMNELTKIKKIINSKIGREPDEILLVIDATTGQNGVLQARGFNEATPLSGIILTKMDSSSKGGIILSIKEIFNIPVKFIGLGESLDDLEVFDFEKYLRGLTKGLENEQEEIQGN